MKKTLQLFALILFMTGIAAMLVAISTGDNDKVCASEILTVVLFLGGGVLTAITTSKHFQLFGVVGCGAIFLGFACMGLSYLLGEQGDSATFGLFGIMYCIPLGVLICMACAVLSLLSRPHHDSLICRSCG